MQYFLDHFVLSPAVLSNQVFALVPLLSQAQTLHSAVVSFVSFTALKGSKFLTLDFENLVM